MRIRVGLLDVVVEIHTDDPDAGELLSLLWAQMPAPGGAAPVRTYHLARKDSGEWLATAGDDIEATHVSLWSVLDALRYRMLELFEERLEGYVTLHAAAVARNDHLVLIAGESGAGKTTLTLALLDAGWTYLSDDVAPVSLTTALVHPFPKPLGVKDTAVWADVAGAFGRVAELGPPAGSFLVPPGKWDVAPEPLPARTLLFPRFSPGAPVEVETLSTAAAAAVASPYVRRLDPTTVALLNRVCAGATCCRVAYGSSAAAIRTIEKLLDDDST